MKRRFKLISSIASLTAAVALLVVGVYSAAIDRNVNVSGTVGFKAKFVDATVTATEARGLEANSEFNETVTFTSDNQEETGQTYKEIKDLGIAPEMQLDDTNLVYSYTLVIKATGASEVHVKFTHEAEVPGLTILVTGLEEGKGVATLGEGGELTIKVTYTVEAAKLATTDAAYAHAIAGEVVLATTEAGLNVA
jgi:hypothetical protein